MLEEILHVVIAVHDGSPVVGRGGQHAGRVRYDRARGRQDRREVGRLTRRRVHSKRSVRYARPSYGCNVDGSHKEKGSKTLRVFQEGFSPKKDPI